MLKKLLSGVGYLAIMATLGFAIYYYVLNPNSPLKEHVDYSGLSTAPFFAAKFPNENGKIQDLNQYKGKVIVLNFWASWCPPCREEMPELSSLYNKYQQKNVVVIGLAVEELAAMRQLSLNTPISYPIIAGDMEGMTLASQLGNGEGGLPYTVIINTDGMVKNVYIGRINLPKIEKILDNLLQPK
ncbi:MAG: TlpA disulfide reductase family protein [Methylophilaceae bacterium]